MTLPAPRRALAVLVSCLLALAACGGDGSDTATADVTTSTTTSVPAGAAPDDPSDDDQDADPADDDAGDDSVPTSDRFGTAVCLALLPAFDGRIDDLAAYADADVLVELARIGGPVVADDVFGEPTGSCGYAIGDVDLMLVLVPDDGDEGERAIATEEIRYTGDTVGDQPDGIPLDDAVAEHHASMGCTASPDEPFYDFAVVEGEGFGVTVVAISCEFFAYQEQLRLATWNGSVMTPLFVPVWVGDGEFVEDDAVVGVLGFDAGEIVVFQKYRGPGDCGSVQRWFVASVDGDDIAYDTLSVREQLCNDDGSEANPNSDEWPLVYAAGE